MNKLISTLFCGALALATVSAQDIAPKYFKLKVADGKYLVQLAEDSTVVSDDAILTNSNAALWEVKKDDRQVSGNYAYQFLNKELGSLKVDSKDFFAVGTYETVFNALDTLGKTGAVAKTLFYTANNAGVSLKSNPDANGVVNSKKGEEIKVILEVPGKRWLTSADLNENTEYTFTFLSDITGAEESTYFFNVAPGHDGDNEVFTIVSKDSKNVFSVDSANWTENSSVNWANQQKAFGFKLGFNKSPFTHFGLYYDPATDKVAVAVRDSSLGWDVEKRKLATSIKSDVAAFVGYAKFVVDSVVTTVDANDYVLGDLPTPENGIVFWVDAPQKGKAIASPFSKNPYVLTIVSKDKAKDGKIKAIQYNKLDVNGGPVDLPKGTSTVEPENQWYIKETVKAGKYYYDVVNRYYGVEYTTDARITKVADGYIFKADGDTLKVTEVTNPAGFKVFSEYERAAQGVKLNIVNSLGAEGATLVLKDDTLVVAGDKDGLAFQVKVADGYAKQDSFPYAGSLTAPKTLSNVNDIYGVYTLFTTSGEDTLFLGFDNVKEKLVLSKYATKSAFVFKSDTEQAYKLLPIYSPLKGDTTLRVHENGAYTEKIDYHNVLASLFTISGTAAKFEYKALPAGHYTFRDESATSTGLDYLTKRENGEAKFLRVGDELKAASVQSDFSLWVDSASVATSGIESLTPSYYILKGAEHFANGDSLKGNFLTVKGKYDELNDSINFVADTLKGVRVNDERAKIKKESAFLFRITDKDSVYEIVPFEEIVKAEPRRLALINGVVVSSSDKTALPILVKGGAEIPVANEDITAADAVKVYAEQGAVRVQNAAGKSVTISNILGQTVATTIITSDDVTIAAPKGIVVVAIEGEKAVKAIVK